MPMHFIYALINFLILGAILFFAARKMVARIFAGRRDRINKELDEAEAAIAEGDVAVSDSNDLIAAAEEEINAEAKSAVDAGAVSILRESEESIKRQTSQSRQERVSLRRDMLDRARTLTLDALHCQVIALMSDKVIVEEFRKHESGIADRILSCIKLTPGDHTYLAHHDVLYVTLTSAFPLDEAVVKKIENAATALLDSVNGKLSFWVRTDETCIGGLRLRIGDTVYDGTVSNALEQLIKRLKVSHLASDASADSMLDGLLKSINQDALQIDRYQLGRVISISDGICWLDGLADIMYGEIVEFAGGSKGMIQDIEPGRIGCMIIDRYEHIESGTPVRRVGKMASVPVGDELLGRVVDAMGNPIDGLGTIWATESRPIEFKAPGITQRKSVCAPMHTGIKAIDSLIPIGKGQRELIIGDRQTGKTAIAMDAIINQRGKNTLCIYVAIGQKDTTVAEIYEKLKEEGAMSYTTIVCANASSSACEQYMAPFAGTAMGEYFMYNGRDVLIVYDDLSKHAVAYRELSLLLHRPSGREAYPGDVFYLHSRLLERSARLADELGGGSMTALPIIETQSGDISSYIPTNAISITDGQIFLETDLFNEGQRPAVNVGLSVSRVGGAAQTKLMKQVSGNLRMILAQYRELSTFAQFGSDMDENTKRTLASGERMMAALRQRRYAPLSDWETALVLFAVEEGFADGIAVENMAEYEKHLIKGVKEYGGSVMATLGSGNKMDDGFKAELKKLVSQLTERFVYGRTA